MSRWRLDDGQIEVVDEDLAAVLRTKTPAEKVAMMADCHRTMRVLIAGQVRGAHPEWSEAAVQAEVARRLLRAAT